MTDVPKDVKPKIPPTKSDVDYINLKVQESNGESQQFRIKKKTPLSKLMDAFCKSRQVGSQTYVFFFEGDRIDGASSPASLKMEEDDQIDAFLHQAGGCGGNNLGCK